MTAHDWRGTPIEPGAVVIYGAGVGRSIQLVEGEVVGFTASGRVRVRVIRRSYLSGSKPVVDVGPDRLTVVEALPPTVKPTQATEAEAAAERSRAFASHDWPPMYLSGWTPNPDRRCRACGVEVTAFDGECPGTA